MAMLSAPQLHSFPTPRRVRSKLNTNIMRNSRPVVISALPDALAAITESPARDIAATALAAAGSLVWTKVFDLLASRGVLDQKLSRKLVHITTGPIFVLTWPLFGSEPYSRAAAALVPALNAARLFLIGSGAWRDEGAVRSISRGGDRTELLRGPLYYCIAMVAATAFGWRDSAVGFTALSLLCGGDGLADIVGRRWGKSNPLAYNPQKSLAGSAAMLVGGFSMSVFFVGYFTALGYFKGDLPPLLPPLLLVSLLCTAVESLPIGDRLDDNLSVPTLAWALGWALFPPAAAAAAVAYAVQ